MKNLSYKNVSITDGFWHEKQQLNENVTINAVYNRFKDTGRIDAFRFDWKDGDEKKPHVFWDSDVAKWMEGVAYILAKKEDKKLEEKVESLIDYIEENQEDDGYFNIYFTVCDKAGRFKHRGLHELYCAGHLIEAAVAYYEATGKDRFLKCMIKYVDCIEKAFIIDQTAAFTTPGHEEIELALYRLYKCTGTEKYLDMMMFFLNMRGAKKEVDIANEFNEYNDQRHKPLREQTEAEGHSVRACYLYSAMADAAKEKDDSGLLDACKKIFDDIINKKMYITGGLGSTRLGESFTCAYDLPSDKAYAETCASISMMYFAHRMQKLENNSVYADIVEREMYNGALSGISFNGKAFFYENPLEIDLDNYSKYHSTYGRETYAITERQEIFGCSCCPPNINRLFASIGDYVYGYEDGSIFVNQFMTSNAEIDGMKISIETNYPHSGAVKIKAENVQKLYIRIPSWCRSVEISEEYKTVCGYALIETPGKEINVNFEMLPILIEADPRVKATSGCVAVMYGPVVYCAEGCDNAFARLHEMYISAESNFEVKSNETFACNEIIADGFKKIGSGKLYAPVSNNYEPIKLTLIPFAYHANRGKTDMRVWINLK